MFLPRVAVSVRKIRMQDKSGQVDEAMPVIEPTVFIVDDDSATRDSLRRLVESVGLKAQGYGCAREFLEGYDSELPGCLVLDVRMPGMSGLELQRQLAPDPKHLPVIFITGYADIPMVVQAMKDGAVGFLEKPFSDQELLDCIQRAVGQDAEQRRAETYRAELAQRVATLTPREHEVMGMVVDGNGSKEIARRLGLSPKTVEIHRAHIMEKLQARSIATLVRYVLIVTKGARTD